MDRIPVLAVVLLGVLLGPSLAMAASTTDVTISFKPEAEVFNATVMAVVFNQSVSIQANGTYTINVTLPSKWSLGDVAAVHIIASGVSDSIDLTALDANGSTLATATIVPLSTEYHTVLPANTAKIKLAAQNAANATIVVYVQSQPVRFKVSLDEKSVTLKVGQTAWVHGVLKQVGGPSGWVYGKISTTSPLIATAYWGTYNKGDVVSQDKSVDNPIDTTGANWSQPFSIHIDTTSMTAKNTGQYKVTLLFYYDYTFETTNQNAELVATVTLEGNMTANTLKLTDKLNNVDYKSLGVGAVIVLLLGLLFLGSKGKGRGRRGAANPIVILILVLVLLAGLGFALGLMDFDLKTKYRLDPAYLGIGMLAMLSLVLMFKAGYARVPRIFKR